MLQMLFLRNEKRIFQEAVDALIDNSIQTRNQHQAAMSQSQKDHLNLFQIT